MLVLTGERKHRLSAHVQRQERGRALVLGKEGHIRAEEKTILSGIISIARRAEEMGRARR